MSDSRPLYAGRRPPSHQVSRGLVPGWRNSPGFDDACILNGASSESSLSFVFRTCTCSDLDRTFHPTRSPHTLFTAAARTGLRPAPESRFRRVVPHHSRSFTVRIQSCWTPSVPLQHICGRRRDASRESRVWCDPRWPKAPRRPRRLPDHDNCMLYWRSCVWVLWASILSRISVAPAPREPAIPS